MLPESHPGFFDTLYRERRDKIAQVANTYQQGMSVPDVPYILEEHKVWESINGVLSSLYIENACKEYVDCYSSFQVSKDKIPQFSAINQKLGHVNFTVSPVAGLVSSREFLSTLSNGTMLCTQYIRHHSVPEYTPEPDVIHEILGHCVFFLNDDIRSLNKLFGSVAKNASDETIEKLNRLYWHTIEFGTCYENGVVKAYGAGLLSSIYELTNLRNIPLRKFDVLEMQQTNYDTTNPQPFLFCGSSFSQIIEDLTEHLSSLL